MTSCRKIIVYRTANRNFLRFAQLSLFSRFNCYFIAKLNNEMNVQVSARRAFLVNCEKIVQQDSEIFRLSSAKAEGALTGPTTNVLWRLFQKFAIDVS